MLQQDKAERGPAHAFAAEVNSAVINSLDKTRNTYQVCTSGTLNYASAGPV